MEITVAGRCVIKWFRHDSAAHEDAKLQRVLVKYGADGYALYWYCIELIAGRVDRDNYTFELEHDAELLGYKLKIDTKRVEEIMSFMLQLKLFHVNPDTERIVCLKLATRLDDSTSENPRDKIRNIEGEGERRYPGQKRIRLCIPRRREIQDRADYQFTEQIRKRKNIELQYIDIPFYRDGKQR